MRIVVESQIQVEPDVAFDRMADVRNETAWNDRVTRAELVSEEPIGAGTQFRTVNRGKEYDATITTYERPRRLAFEVTGAAMDIEASFTFESDGDGGTTLRGEFDAHPKGAMRVLLPVLGPLIRRDFPKQSRSFAAFCESASS